jgi:hypothetical protein
LGPTLKRAVFGEALRLFSRECSADRGWGWAATLGAVNVNHEVLRVDGDV